MDNKKEDIKNDFDVNQYSNNKYDTAIGLFYAVGLFVGIGLFFILLLLFNFEWLISLIIGVCCFLIFGFISHAIISLSRKDR